MPDLIFGRDHIVVPWICGQLGMHIPVPCVSIGVAKDGRLIGGALYHNQCLDTAGKPFMIEMSFATIDPRWGSRAIIDNLLGYPFRQQKVKRVQSTISKKNRNVRQFLERLGFSLEGVGRQAWPQGGDACMYSMLSREFFFSKWNLQRGKIRTFSSNPTRSGTNLCGADSQQQGNGALPIRA